MPPIEGSWLWWWLGGLAMVALLLVVLGRVASRANVADQVPPDSSADVKPTEHGQEPDIRPEDNSKR